MLHHNTLMPILSPHPLSLSAGLASRAVLAVTLGGLLWAAVGWALSA